MSKFGFNTADYKPLALVTPRTLDEQPGLADTPLDYALRYADLGWYVLPVRPDKKPLEGYGLNSATKDPAVIRNIWGEHPDAGIAVACERSGLVVLDIDPRNGGRETLARLEAEHGVLHTAIAAVTQGGGEHRLFRADPQATYPGTLGAGVDIKHRGYVCVEPTRGDSGVYRWREDKDPLRGALPLDAPRLLSAPPRTDDPNAHGRIRPGSVVVAPQVYADLERALASIPPECEYGTWFRVLQGLSRLADADRAYAVARGWSLRSRKPGHTEDDLRRKWHTALREDYSVNYQTIFHLAAQYSPAAPPPPDSGDPPPTPHPLSFTHSAGSGAGAVAGFEYVFDRFMSTGVNVVAGSPGVGKTTLIVPLALAAAHLCPPDYALRPRVRRNVVIITESVVQVQRVIYSLAQWGDTGLRAEDFEQHVRVIPARRLDAAVVAGVAAEYRHWTHDNPKADGTQHAALPLIVMDTANAVFDLENENDNAEVGRTVALLKQAFTDFPLIIVAHTSKLMGTGEADGLSPRGASAWTGDAQGVYTVFKDGEDPDAPRVLKAVKVRFPTAYPELVFELTSNREPHPNILGELEDEWFAHSTARPLRPGERTQLKEDNKEKKIQDEWVALCDEMLELVRTHPEHSRSYYERLTRAAGGVGYSQERKERAVQSLLADGCLKVVMLDKPKGRADHYLRVNEDVVRSTQAGRYAV